MRGDPPQSNTIYDDVVTTRMQVARELQRTAYRTKITNRMVECNSCSSSVPLIRSSRSVDELASAMNSLGGEREQPTPCNRLAASLPPASPTCLSARELPHTINGMVAMLGVSLFSWLFGNASARNRTHPKRDGSSALPITLYGCAITCIRGTISLYNIQSLPGSDRRTH